MAKSAKDSDPRPPVAVGHVFLEVRDVAAAGQWCEAVGMRRIFANENIAVLELRGGTHLVVSKARRSPAPGSEAPFDIMVDDLAAARRDFAKKGLAPSRVKRGSIHSSFTLSGPEGYAFSVVSSHAGKRPV